MRPLTERRLDPRLEKLVEQHALVPSLFRDHPQPMVLYESDGRIVVGNAAAVRLLGHRPGTLVGSHFSAHLAPSCVLEADKVRSLALAGCASEFEAVCVHADGHPVPVSTTIVPARLGEEIIGFYGIVREVRHERAVAAAVEQADRFRSLYLIAAAAGKTPAQQIEDSLRLGNELLAAECAVVMQSANGVITPAYTVGAMPLESLQSLAFDVAVCRAMFGTFDSVAIDDIDRPPWHREPVRRLFPWHSFIATTFEVGGRFAGIVLFGSRRRRGALFSTDDREFVRLISAVIGSTLERQRQREHLDALAFSDTLTGLPNRALLHDRLEELIVESRRGAQSFAVHFLDLDGFKHVNDTAGHAAGDDVLRQAAQRLKDALHAGDSVARLGGDEFIILQPVGAAEEAPGLARTLLARMRMPFVTDAGAFMLGASIGISLFPTDGDAANALLRNADVALYRAKSGGRNRYALFNPPPTVRSVRSRTLPAPRE